MYHLGRIKKIHSVLKKCKSFSIQMGRSSSYSSLRSKSNREIEVWGDGIGYDGTEAYDHDYQYNFETVYVGSTRRKYMISSKYLNHPLLNALIEKTSSSSSTISVKCEVVLFDHLLLMIDQNEDPHITSADNDGFESFEELAQLYAYS